MLSTEASAGSFERPNGLTSLADSKNQSRALSALVIVSWVVNVLEATMKSVVSGLHCLVTSARSVPSMLDTKCAFKSRFE